MSGGQNHRMSDSDREAVIARLNSAVADGRLSLVEFEERVDGVLRARTFGEVEPFVADLPGTDSGLPVSDVVELRSHAGEIKRMGRWAVPRRLVVQSRAGMVKLDMRHAVISHRVVDIDLSTQAGSTVIVLPAGASANIDGVVTSAGSARLKVPQIPEGGAPHFVVTGSAAAGSLVVRYERRFWRWRW